MQRSQGWPGFSSDLDNGVALHSSLGPTATRSWQFRAEREGVIAAVGNRELAVRVRNTSWADDRGRPLRPAHFRRRVGEVRWAVSYRGGKGSPMSVDPGKMRSISARASSSPGWPHAWDSVPSRIGRVRSHMTPTTAGTPSRTATAIAATWFMSTCYRPSCRCSYNSESRHGATLGQPSDLQAGAADVSAAADVLVKFALGETRLPGAARARSWSSAYVSIRVSAAEP